ncbi:MAG TPA: hypothetical protein VK178_05330 [Opitutaceae bacterium]|nr:hypothetical protein [Opitutaceae bacterium]
MKKPQVRVRKERHYRPHTEFYHAVWVHLEHVRERQPGCFYSMLSALMMSAFTIEAYLNYVGPLVEPSWDDFEKAAPLAKLRHVAAMLRIEVDDGCRPMQTIVDLFRFRNRMAHPRPDHVVEDHLSTDDEYQNEFYTEPRPKWFKFATEANGRRCYEDVGRIVETINSRLPHPEPLPLTDMGWSGRASST